MKIIFLDIDGVLNCEDSFKQGLSKYTDYKDIHYQKFYEKSKYWLNKLIEESNSKIVISSTWRSSGLEWLKKVWESEKMSSEIIDITPNLRNDKISIPRGLEIKEWLEDNNFISVFWSKEIQEKYLKESGITNYIIIDDDSDMLYNQRKHFVHVKPSPRNTSGFGEEHYKRGLEILSKTIVDLNY